MNHEFYVNIIEELESICNDLDKVALEEANTHLWRIHQRAKETLKSVKFYFAEEFPNG